MLPGGLIAALVGAAGATALVLYKRKKATTPAPSGNSCDDLCAGLEKLGVPSDACKAGCAVAGVAGKIAGAIGFTTDESIAQDDAENKAGNGPVELDLPEDLKAISHYNDGPALRGSVLRFKNGCTPFRSSPGWTKCAPGTHDMTPGTPGSVEHTSPRHVNVNADPDAMYGHMFDGGDSDITTGVGLASPNHDGRYSNSGNFFWKGKPFQCASGAPDWTTRDNRAGADGRPQCAGAGWTPNPNRITPPPALHDGGHDTPAGVTPSTAHGGVTVTSVPR